MNRRDDVARRVLRWYPVAWRERYGNELVDLLLETYPQRRLPARAWLAIARAGTNEYCRATGFVGRASRRADQLRAGALTVLAAWSLFVVAGAGFAKYSEHWDVVTPRASRAIPATAMTVLQIAAFVGGALCLVAAVLSGRSFVRLFRENGVGTTLRLVRPAFYATLIAVVTTSAIVVMAHHLTSSQRNGGLWLYQWAGLAWVATVVVCLAVGTITLGRVALRLEYSVREFRVLSWLALGTTGSMFTIFASLLVWWVQMARHAGWFFASGIMGSARAIAPAPMIGCGLMMLVGLAVASWGTRRALMSRHDLIATG